MLVQLVTVFFGVVVNVHGFGSVQPGRSRISLARRASTATTSETAEGAVASWHAQRRLAITRELGRDTIDELSRARPWTTIGLLASVDLGQLYLAGHVGNWWLLAGATAGAWLSLAQFTLSHDLLHGPKRHRDKLFWLSMPSIFGYWLYLELGHLQHHASTGDGCGKVLFDSSSPTFEDGDVFFVSHRQETPGGVEEDPGTISISRFAYRNLWTENDVANALVYSWSMLAERASLGMHDKLVALTGFNLFFPNKPESFHEKCATYARCAALVQLAVFAMGGWRGLGYLLVSETAWQLPFFPASSLFFSNHGLREHDGKGVGGADDGYPTHSVYGSPLFDFLCCNANYHVEHHDFPAMPIWSLPELRAKAGKKWYPDSPNWTSIVADSFRSKILYPRWAKDDLPPLSVTK